MILYSYQTPVAYYNVATDTMYRTAAKHSRTTSKHINAWVRNKKCVEKPQEFFNNLI